MFFCAIIFLKVPLLPIWLDMMDLRFLFVVSHSITSFDVK